MQKRAIRIVYPDADYQTSLIVAGIDTLRERRELLTAKFFKRQVLASSSLLHSLLPDRRDNDNALNLCVSCAPIRPIALGQSYVNKLSLTFHD